MKFGSVVSSNLSGVGYCEKTKTLGVLFSSGTLYFYQGVPQKVYENFVSAESLGKFFSATIKPHYEFFQIEDLQNVDLGKMAPVPKGGTQ